MPKRYIAVKVKRTLVFENTYNVFAKNEDDACEQALALDKKADLISDGHVHTGRESVVVDRKRGSSKPKSVHYIGGVKYQLADGSVQSYLAGWPVCCTGERCEKIKASGATTWKVEEVTCPTCRRRIERARTYKEPPRFLPYHTQCGLAIGSSEESREAIVRKLEDGKYGNVCPSCHNGYLESIKDLDIREVKPRAPDDADEET